MQLPKFLDEYTFRARLFPALITGASAICAFFVLAPWEKMGLPQLAATLASGVLLFALADLARREGKRLEPRLFEQWGGKPSIVMLRYADSRLDAGTKAQYHKFLATKINAVAPSPTDEKKRLADCDAFYDRCGTWLRENTRDTKKYKILFEENVTYGFRRNLFALKYAALAIDAIIIVGCTVGLWPSIPFAVVYPKSGKLLFIAAFAIVHAGYISFAATELSVREAAQQYARQLLLCCETYADSVARKKTRPRRLAN